jgi:hypothetical protein
MRLWHQRRGSAVEGTPRGGDPFAPLTLPGARKGPGTTRQDKGGARMSETRTPSEPKAHPHNAHNEAVAPRARPEHPGHRRRLSPFWRHFLEMLGAMAAGMLVTGAIFIFVTGATTWEEVTSRYPTQVLLAMAAGMTIPMVVWMSYRGMGRRNSYEMAAAMILPVIPFLCLVWFNITQSAQCGAYCGVMVVAMLALMRYRRSEYSTHSMQAM